MIDTTNPGALSVPDSTDPNATPNRIASPQTFADLVGNANASTAAVAADNTAIAAIQTTYTTSLAAAQGQLNADTTTQQSDAAAVTAEVTNRGLRFVVNPDGSATIFELNQAGQVTLRTAQNAAVPLTPAPQPQPQPAGN